MCLSIALLVTRAICLRAAPIWTSWVLLLWWVEYSWWSGRCPVGYLTLPCVKAAGQWWAGLGSHGCLWGPEDSADSVVSGA